jgi:hypothetical protein
MNELERHDRSVGNVDAAVKLLPAREPLAENFFNGPTHRRAGLARADDGHAIDRIQGDSSRTDVQRASAHRERGAEQSPRRHGVHTGLPDRSRVLAQAFPFRDHK